MSTSAIPAPISVGPGSELATRVAIVGCGYWG